MQKSECIGNSWFPYFPTAIWLAQFSQLYKWITVNKPYEMFTTMEIFSKIQSLCQNLNLNTDGCPKNYKFDKCAEWNHAINRQQLQGEYQKKQ